MPVRSLIKRKEMQEREEKAKKLYEIGYTTREVGKIVGRSHNWVAVVVKKTYPQEQITKT